MRIGFPRAALPVCLLTVAICLAAAPDLTVGGIPLGNEIHSRRHADSLKSLISRTKPTLVWSDRNMLWVDRDASGDLLFALNQAYQVDDAHTAGSWTLFEADPSYIATGFVDFTRTVTRGTVLSSDRRGGTVYLLEWTARHQTGGGPVNMTRHILVLHTPTGHWQLIGEGPGATDAHASNKLTTTRVLYAAEWTKDPSAPLKIRATQTTRISFTSEETQASIESAHDFELTGKLPARLSSTSTDYLTSRYGDTVGEIAMRLATCGTFYPLERTPALKSKMLQNVVASLASLNPKLPRKPHPGMRITLPNLASLWDDANHAAGIKNHPSH